MLAVLTTGQNLIITFFFSNFPIWKNNCEMKEKNKQKLLKRVNRGDRKEHIRQRQAEQ